MFFTEAVLAAAYKHWKVCLALFFLGYATRVTQIFLRYPMIAAVFVGIVLVLTSILSVRTFAKAADPIELRYSEIAGTSSMLLGLLAGRMLEAVIVLS